MPWEENCYSWRLQIVRQIEKMSVIAFPNQFRVDGGGRGGMESNHGVFYEIESWMRELLPRLPPPPTPPLPTALAFKSWLFIFISLNYMLDSNLLLNEHWTYSLYTFPCQLDSIIFSVLFLLLVSCVKQSVFKLQ